MDVLFGFQLLQKKGQQTGLPAVGSSNASHGLHGAQFESFRSTILGPFVQEIAKIQEALQQQGQVLGVHGLLTCVLENGEAPPGLQ